MTDLPLAGLTFALVGPGRVGTSLAAWAVAKGAWHLTTTGRGAAMDPRAVRSTAPRDKVRRIPLGELATAGADLLLLAVPDGALAEVAATLARRPQARVALHTAGGLDAGVLSPLRAAGSAIGTFHPLKAFPRPLPDPAQAKGVFFALDGDGEAIALGRRLAAAWGAVAAEVPAASRPLYHLAASLAAGGVTTLLATATDLARRLGLPPAVGTGYLELARGAVEAALAAGDPTAAFTGPLLRGDSTFIHQLELLAAAAPDQLPLVLHLARETMRHLERRGPLTVAQADLLAALEKHLSTL